MLYTQLKYIRLMASSLDRFKEKGSNRFNFRCPLCGDSKKSKSKARGNVYEHNGGLMFKCHNCGISISFISFLKEVNPSLYSEYHFESFRQTNREQQEELVIPEIKMPEKFQKTGILKCLPSISELSEDHPARRWVEKRNLPETTYSDLYYAESFYFNKYGWDDARILIPFYDQDKNLIAVQGRAIDPENKMRYITVTITGPIVYGMDNVDESKPIHVFEGPFDSMFIPNSIATASASNKSYSFITYPASQLIYCYDNEPRNRDICKFMESALRRGSSVVIWPKYIKEKDVNDMISSGKLSVSDVLNVIRENSVSGSLGLLKMKDWKQF